MWRPPTSYESVIIPSSPNSGSTLALFFSSGFVSSACRIFIARSWVVRASIWGLTKCRHAGHFTSVQRIPGKTTVTISRRWTPTSHARRILKMPINHVCYRRVLKATLADSHTTPAVEGSRFGLPSDCCADAFNGKARHDVRIPRAHTDLEVAAL